MQMEEVRPVLHVIFRHLLKRLDDQELREPEGPRQGKTCPVFHNTDFQETAQAGLWTLWTALLCPSEAHSLSTDWANQQAVRSDWNPFVIQNLQQKLARPGKFVLRQRATRDKSYLQWMDFNP